MTIDSGTVHGDFSIAVPDYSTDNAHTITLGGGAPGILYKDQSSTSTDELGIWANDITVNSTTTTGYEFDGAFSPDTLENARPAPMERSRTRTTTAAWRERSRSTAV